MINNDLFDSYLMSQYVKECGFNQPQDFEKAPLRILFHFPGNMAAKVVSATHFCLYNCVKRTFPEVFVDICFEPFEWARNTYYKTHKPMVGYFSKRSWEDFDMIGLSNAISMSDYADTYRNLVNAGFPLKRSSRDDKVVPFIWAGGIANDGAEAFNTIVDMCCEGLGERSIPKLVEFALDHDPKLPANRDLIRKTFQGKYGYYDPSIYKYEWGIVDGHVESVWKNPELGVIIPEVSLPIDKYGKTDDIKYKDTTPGGQGKVSLLSSWGCSSAKGTCNFSFENDTLFRTTKGLVKGSKLRKGMHLIDAKGNERSITAVYKDLDPVECLEFELNNGQKFTVSIHHDLIDENYHIKWSEDFRPGDQIQINFTKPTTGTRIDCWLAWLAGFASGDGYVLGNSVRFCVGNNSPYKDDECRLIKERLDHLSIPHTEWRNKGTCLELSADATLLKPWILKEDTTKLTTLDYDSFIAWFAGFMQADGTIYTKVGTVGFTQKSYEFMSTMQQVLAYFGIPSRFEKYYNKNDKLYAGFETLYGKTTYCYRSFLTRLFLVENPEFSDLLVGVKKEAACKFRDKVIAPNAYSRVKNKIKKWYQVKSITPVGVKGVMNLTVDPDHLVTIGGCIGSMQCHEARLYGSFRERDMTDLEQALHDAKASSMGEAFSYFSFNSNFHSHYPESLALAYDYFDRLSILNMRVDALAASIRNDPVNNYVRLIKELGANSMSCPSEGWGERLRNHFLNKNLTHDDLMLVAKEAFKQHFARLKIGYIRTYYETDADWKEGFGELFEICKMRDDMGVNCKIQATCTSLVHNFGTPLYFKPRASAYAEWLKEFHSDKFYEYPYMPLVDQGIKVNLNGGKDTFVQQLMQDLPHELVEDILLKPALTTRTLSGDYVKLVKEGLERHGIDPRKQFLKFDPHKNPHQHIEVNPCQDGFDEPGFCEKNVTMCLKTPATVIHGLVTKCDNCGACQRIDKERIVEGLDKRSHVKWMLTRELNTKYDIMDIKTAKLKNRPNYQYEFIFKVNEKGYYVSKEHLARRWMVQLAKFDDSIVKSFRSFKGSFYTYADYPGLPSVIDGYMVCYPSFKDKLPENYQELIDKANAECEAIQCIAVHEHLEAGYPNYLYLYKIDLKVSALETKEYVESIKSNPFRIYEENTSDYTEFETNFWIKQVGSSILILAPGRINAAYSLLTKCTFNKMMNKVLKHQSVLGIFSRVSDVELVNIVTGKPQAVAGFDFVSKGSFGDREFVEDTIEIEGA